MADIVGKYQFVVCDSPHALDVPKGAEFLHVAMQHGMVTLWARIDPKAKTERRTFYIHGTGQLLSPYEKYVGTAFDNAFVWHLFEATL